MLFLRKVWFCFLLDKNVTDFHFENFCFGLERGFINEPNIQEFNTDIKTALLQSEEDIHNDFIFTLFHSLSKIAVHMNWANNDYANQFTKTIAYFGEEILSDANLKITQKNREQGYSDSQQGLFLLAAYCLRQNKKQLCKQNLALLKDAIIAVFLQFAENEALSHKWQWEQWFKEEKGEPKISQKIDLRDFVCHLLLFYLKDKKQALAMLKKQPFKKEHLNYLERLHTLCAKKSSLKISLKKILQETLKQEMQKQSVAVLEEKKLELFQYSNEEYKSETKLANFIKLKSVATKTTKITTQWIFAKKHFLEKKPLSLEEYDYLAENLIELEHKHCLKKLKSVIKFQNISYKHLFTELAPRFLAEKDTHILFFYQKSRYFGKCHLLIWFRQYSLFFQYSNRLFLHFLLKSFLQDFFQRNFKAAFFGA